MLQSVDTSIVLAGRQRIGVGLLAASLAATAGAPSESLIVRPNLRECMRIGIYVGVPGMGSAPAVGGVNSLLDVVSAAKVLAYYRADAGSITIDASDHANGVAQWNDLSGNGRHLTQPTGAKMPTWGATTGPNNKPGVTFDGSDDAIRNTTFQLPTPAGPGTVLYYGVLKQTVWGANRTYVCAGRAAAWECGIYQSTATPQLAQANATAAQNLNNGAAVGAFSRMKALFTGVGPGSDYLKLGSTTVTTGTPGVQVPDIGLWLGSRADQGTTFMNGVWSELLVCNAELTGGEDAAADAYITDYYGAGLV
jgi:hypothetical protein